MFKNKKLALLLNGDFPKKSTTLNIIPTYDIIIACDGAYNKATNLGIIPDYVIGDLDSIVDLDCIPKSKIIYNTCQNTNDMKKGLDWILQNNGDLVDIYGGSGIRDDHFLSNILIILDSNPSIDKRFISDYGIFSSQKKNKEYDSFEGQQISIFASDKTISISASNLKYKIDKLKCEPGYRLFLNESTADRFTVNNSHGTILVYQVFKNKC